MRAEAECEGEGVAATLGPNSRIAADCECFLNLAVSDWLWAAD